MEHFSSSLLVLQCQAAFDSLSEFLRNASVLLQQSERFVPERAQVLSVFPHVRLVVRHLRASAAVALEVQRAAETPSRLADLWRGRWCVVVVLEVQAQTVAVSKARGTVWTEDRENGAVDGAFVPSESMRSGELLEASGTLELVLVPAHY